MTGHLTDAEIQAYLDHSGTLSRQQLLHHIESCTACKDKLTLYQTLYAGLSTAPSIQLPVDFAEKTVSAAMPLHKTPPHRFPLGEDAILIFGLGFLGLGVSAFFIDWTAVLTSLEQAGAGLRNMRLPQNHLLTDMLSRFGRSLTLLPVAGVAAGLIAWLDHYLQKHKPGHTGF